jgi:hypothetical protein
VNITGQLNNIGIIFHHNAFETPLKEMPGSAMAVIKSSAIGYAKPLHGPRQIRPFGLPQDVIYGWT